VRSANKAITEAAVTLRSASLLRQQLCATLLRLSFFAFSTAYRQQRPQVLIGVPLLLRPFRQGRP